MTPPVVGPATRSTSGLAVAAAPVGREERAQLARRGRILEDRELLDVGVAVTAALEQEVAVAERAGAPEQRLGPGRDRVAGGGVEGRSNGGHAAVYAGVSCELGRIDPAHFGHLVEGPVRADDLGDALVDARRDVHKIPSIEGRVFEREARDAPHQRMRDRQDRREEVHCLTRLRLTHLGSPDTDKAMEDLLDDFDGDHPVQISVTDP